MSWATDLCARRLFWLATTVLLVLSPARPSRAAEPTPTEIAVARRLFTEATELEQKQRWELAAAKLREAIQIKDTPGLRFHLAHCLKKSGQLVEAMLEYDRASELIAQGVSAADVESRLGPAREELEKRLPLLLIVVPADVPGLAVQIDGKETPRAVLGRPAPVNPGTYRVVARAPGYHAFSREVSIQEGERRTIRIRLTPAPAASPPMKAPPPAPNQPAPDNGQSHARTYTLLGEGAFTVIALGVGVGYLQAKKAADDRIERAEDRVDRLSGRAGDPTVCSDPMGALAQSCDALSDAIADPARDRAKVLSTVGFIGAGVGAVSLALTYLLWPDEPGPIRAALGPGEVFVGAAHSF